MRVSGEQYSVPARTDPPLGRSGEAAVRLDRREPAQVKPLPPDIDFLCRHGVPKKVLQHAARRAAAGGTEARQELFALGFDRGHYWPLLAQQLGLAYAPVLRGAVLLGHGGSATADAVRLATAVLVRYQGRSVLVLAPRPKEITLLEGRLKQNPALGERMWIAAPETIRAFLVARRHTALTHYAVNRLARVLPRMSARDLLRRDRVKGPVTLLAACIGLGLVAPATMLNVAGTALTLTFLNCGVWKTMAALRRPRPLKLEPVADPHLPTYTVLVPLYREAAVVPALVHHLGALDYPAAKLQILLLLEADDAACRAAVARHATSALFEVVVVPPGEPRTKPKALTYAMPFARGEFVVVFDAEDRPEPDQLRKAAAAFREQPDLGCVQARLAPDHEGTWFSRMFKIEYAANFEVLLPALADARVPLPLGGTSNHFPRKVLERVGAWDPYNVTEDADLGIRLARFGFRTATLLSRTYEEAPLHLRHWLPQRRRWIKGWMQTSLLCIAGPVPPDLRLPLRQTLALHGIVSAGVVGLLIYPVSALYFMFGLSMLARYGWPDDIWNWLFLALNANLVVILGAAFISAFRGLREIRALHLVPWIPLLPIYWAFMSGAAWQALFQLLRDPSGWEKTVHGVARNRRTPFKRAF